MSNLNNIDFTNVFPLLTIICLILFYQYYIKAVKPREGTIEWITRIVEKPRFDFIITRHPMEKRDIIPIVVITMMFTVCALFGLGYFTSPQSVHVFSQDDPLIIELDTPEEISKIRYFSGLRTGYYTLELSSDGSDWQEQKPKENNEHAMHQRYSHLFKWREADLNDDRLPAKYIRITASEAKMELSELAIYGSDDKLLQTSRIRCPEAPALFDEQRLIPTKTTYLNSMYFDEIYHGRTALEHLRTIASAVTQNESDELIYPYETTHPPLGKLIISIGIAIFGMVPFGWRVAGALIGAALIPIMYVFVKNLFGKTEIAISAALILGFDFMRYSQTRIATIDTYAVFFILLAYFFMYRFITIDQDSPFHKSIPSLALSGVFFGLGCASKWVVVYAGLGLAVIWIIRTVSLGLYYRNNDLDGFVGSVLLKNIFFSVIFFVLIPVIIYCLSYIPYGLAKNMSIADGMLLNPDFYELIWNNQKSMLSYHGKLIAEHAYSSSWWQWIADLRPILYFRDYAADSKSVIAAFGNPVIWWGGFIAIPVLICRVFMNRDVKALFIVIGYFSQLLPWFFVSRIVFIYHYFPAAIFLILALAHIFDVLYERGFGRYRLAVYGYTASAGLLFCMFFPAISGIYAPVWYFDKFLRWFSSWPL